MTFNESIKNLPDAALSMGSVSIKPITTEAQMVCALYDLALTDEQKDFVNPTWFSVGRAYLNPNDNCPCLIYNEGSTPIGFMNLLKWTWRNAEMSWSFFIDKAFQGRGYGRQAAMLAIRILRSVEPDTPIKLSAEADNQSAHRLYLSLGFRLSDEKDGDDLVFVL
ncbi:MAG: GNAT family N-acetyltransferase [Clostridia bacterium]|nr:GNAT family N-acetyltransferase [Clostridia bacterium]